VAQKSSDLLKSFKGETETIRSVKEESHDTSDTCHITRTNAQLIEIMDELDDADVVFKTVRNPEGIFRLPISLYLFRLASDTGNSEIKKQIKETWLNYFSSFDEIKNYADVVNDVELKSSVKLVEKFGQRILSLETLAKNNVYAQDATDFLTTAHTSKGLEWEHVVVYDDFPNVLDIMAKKGITSIDTFRNAVTDPEAGDMVRNIGEEINLFYVAMTRAKKMLSVQSANEQYIGKSDSELDEILVELYEKHNDESRMRLGIC